jgi:hypothetical protein
MSAAVRIATGLAEAASLVVFVAMICVWAALASVPGV